MSLRTVADASLAPPQFGALQSPDSGQVWFRWSLLRVAIVTADVLAPFEMRVLDNGTIVLSDSSDESPSPPPSPPKPPPRLAARKTARKAVRPTAPARERNGAAAPATKQQQQQQLKQAVATRRKQPSPPASSAAESSEDEAPSRTLRRLKRREAASPPSSPDGMKTRKRASTGAALPVPKKKAAKVEEQSQRALVYHSSFEATPIERAISKRRLISMNGKTGLLNELVGKITYVIGEGIALADRSVTGNLRVEERLIYPETVITLKDMSTPLRTSTAFTTVKKNVQEEDAPILRHVPYLGENATLSIEPLRYDAISITKARIEFTTPEAKTLLKFVVPSALDDEVSEYLLRILVSEFGPSHHVFNLLKKFPVFEQPEADYRTLQDRHRHRQKLTQRIREMKDFVAKAKKSREVASSATAALVNLTTNNRFLRDMSTATASTLLDSFGSSFDSSYLQNPESHGLKEADSLDGMLESYRSLFCRRCFRYDCAEHGIECPLPQKRSDPVDPIARLMEPAADIDSTASPPDVGQYVADRSPDVDSTISSSDENQSSSDGENPLEQTQAEAGPSRRSRRAQTKNCTLASKSLQIQEAMQEKQRSDKLKADRERVARLIKSGRFADCVDNEVLKWVASKAATLESDRATCSQHCWKSTKQENDSKKMPKSTQLILERVVATITKNPCVIAAILTGAPCSQVNNWVKKIIESAKTSTTASDERERSSKRTKRQSKRSSKNGAVQDTPHPYRRAHSYEPCAHDGPCEDCQCVKRGLQCEAACSCSRDCSNRMGCKCGVGNCRTRTCPCFLANRECDPDKCFTCGAAVAALTSTSTSAASKSDAVHENLCANVNMQRGAHKKVAIAFSDVHGYGAFAMEPILKSEFVYEYTGGIISDDEAERRGGIYDRLNLTFLFDLNLDEVVDAMRKGNKSKFANHASGERANCEARIICVRGEHRIGLYAKRDITAGEELLYDYGWVHEDAPSWSQTRTTRAHSEDSWIDAIEIDDD
ncbi:TPA: hypothetical protein N0F65_011146 [Lagenidium giganteum]|uniref:Uncharacterized protein n=1 Tax=Lagenidium giganteum TaxID=4803 RepID=A0AAV2Z7T5_9STRA|nr:TPA: hypothetical protein N0F65_011146 [Lagenidium giganteum]